MSNPPLPKIVWKSVDPIAAFSPAKATDEYGNEWHMSANQEWVILTTVDGRHFEAWTAQGCWNHYVEEGVELNYQTLLVDALQFAWTQAEKIGLLAKSDRFRAVCELARDGKIKVEK